MEPAVLAASPGASGLLLFCRVAACGDSLRCSSIWGVSVIPLAEKWCFRVKPPGRQEALKALELGKVRPRVHQRSSALPIQGQDWSAMAKEGCQEAVRAKAFLDQGGDPRGPDSQTQHFWGRLDTGGDAAASTGTFRGSGWFLGFLCCRERPFLSPLALTGFRSPYSLC